MTHQKPAPRISKASERLIVPIDDLRSTWNNKNELYCELLTLKLGAEIMDQSRIARLEAAERELRKIKNGGK